MLKLKLLFTIIAIISVAEAGKSRKKSSRSKTDSTHGSRNSHAEEPECRMCFQRIPDCEQGCKRDESCQVIKQSCYLCSRAVCVKGEECVKCESMKPKCHCADDETCVISRHTCFECPTAYCVRKMSGIRKIYDRPLSRK